MMSYCFPMAVCHVGSTASPFTAQVAGIVKFIGIAVVGGRLQAGMYQQFVTPLQGGGC